jgi:Short repeat of unknown function (DUF308)
MRSTLLWRGVLAVLVGLVAVIWPNITIVAFVALFAVYASLTAATEEARAFRSETAGPVVGRVLLAVLDLAAGVVAPLWPGITVLSSVDRLLGAGHRLSRDRVGRLYRGFIGRALPGRRSLLAQPPRRSSAIDQVQRPGCRRPRALGTSRSMITTHGRHISSSRRCDNGYTEAQPAGGSSGRRPGWLSPGSSTTSCWPSVPTSPRVRRPAAPSPLHDGDHCPCVADVAAAVP